MNLGCKSFLIIIFLSIKLYCSESLKKEWDAAVIDSNLTVLKKMLQESLISNEEKEVTFLNSIVESRNSVVELLLQNGISPNTSQLTNTCVFTAFFLAAQKNDLEIVNLLIKYGVNPNLASKADDHLIPPIFLALSNHNYEMLEIFLKNGADPNSETVSNVYRINLISNAIILNDLDMVELLLKYGADQNKKNYLNKRSITPLTLALNLNFEIFEILLRYGADYKAYKQEFGPGSYISQEIRDKFKKKETKDLIRSQEIVDYFKDKIFTAYDEGNVSFIELVNEFKKQMSETSYFEKSFLFLKDNNGNTLLHKAIIKSDYVLINDILNFNPKIINELLNLPNNQNMTPIDLSVADETLLNFFMKLAYIPDDSCIIL